MYFELFTLFYHHAQLIENWCLFFWDCNSNQSFHPNILLIPGLQKGLLSIFSNLKYSLFLFSWSAFLSTVPWPYPSLHHPPYNAGCTEKIKLSVRLCCHWPTTSHMLMFLTVLVHFQSLLQNVWSHIFCKHWKSMESSTCWGPSCSIIDWQKASQGRPVHVDWLRSPSLFF